MGKTHLQGFKSWVNVFPRGTKVEIVLTARSLDRGHGSHDGVMGHRMGSSGHREGFQGT